ncbi:tail fiber domain-containing protein [Segnochrobactraceae bacterium EtOH-i3]
MSAQTGADALDFFKGQAAITNAWAAEDRERYQSRFIPLQDAYIEKANNWDSAARQAQVASEAKADVMSNAAAAQQQNQRQMAAMGVNPASGRFAGQTRATALATGLAAAGAENNARSQARNEATAMQANAINMGSGLAVNPAASMQLSNGAMSSGTSAAMTGYGQQGQLLNQQYQNQLDAYNANQQATGSLMSGLGSVAGLALGNYLMKSDKDAKTDKAPAVGKSLGAVKSLPPFESWRYKPGAVPGDTERHIGPYAQDFQKATGLGDGKSINVVDAIGVTMGAVKELAGEVDRLKAGRGIGAYPGPGKSASRK